MERLLVGLLTVIFAVTLSVCSGGPVKSGLEDCIAADPDKMVSVEYSDQFMNNFQRKASLAETPEDFSIVIKEWREFLVDYRQEYGALKPKNKEMKLLVDKVNTSFALMIEDAYALEKAVAEKDQNLMMSTLDKMNKATADLNNGVAALEK